MSRAYRIRVQQTLKKVIRAGDHVSTQLELLQILPPEQMAELLAAALRERGFRPSGPVLVREDKGVTIEIDPQTGAVHARAETTERLELEAEKHGVGDTDDGLATKQIKEALRQELRQDLARQAAQKQAELRQQVTDELEGRLGDLRKELDQVVNRVTAEALKRKAAQLGQIKEMTEDPQNGTLTIVVEV